MWIRLHGEDQVFDSPTKESFCEAMWSVSVQMLIFYTSQRWRQTKPLCCTSFWKNTRTVPVFAIPRKTGTYGPWRFRFLKQKARAELTSCYCLFHCCRFWVDWLYAEKKSSVIKHSETRYTHLIDVKFLLLHSGAVFHPFVFHGLSNDLEFFYFFLNLKLEFSNLNRDKSFFFCCKASLSSKTSE